MSTAHPPAPAVAVSRLLHRGPMAGCDEPMAMLAECHGRVAAMLALLERLRVHLKQGGAAAPARQAAQDLMRYFDEAAPRHHADEELHIVPALRRAGCDELAERLLSEHRGLAGAWAALRRSLVDIAQDLPRDDAAQAAFERAAEAVLTGYRAHVLFEDTIAYPAALPALPAAALQAMAEDMARRRGLVLA